MNMRRYVECMCPKHGHICFIYNKDMDYKCPICSHKCEIAKIDPNGD
jgi:hypothetical protein